jgi:hypothetical protein
VAGGIAIVVCVLALIGAGELLIRVVEGALGASAAEPDPRQTVARGPDAAGARRRA